MLLSVMIVPTVGSDEGFRPHWPKTSGVRKVSVREKISFAMTVIGCVVRVI